MKEKMINLIFMTATRKIIRMEIENKVVRYFDDVWKRGIQFIPFDNATYTLLKTGKADMKVLAALILDANKGRNLVQYRNCKTDEELANVIKKDAKLQGLREVN